LRRLGSFKVTDFGANQKLIYNVLLVINTNLPPILHPFRDIAFDKCSKSLYLATTLAFKPPGGGVPLGQSP